MFWTNQNQLKSQYNWDKLPSLFRQDLKLCKTFYQELFTRIKTYQDTNFCVRLFEKAVFEKLDDPKFWDYRNQKLFGLPYFVKENFVVKNHPCEGGSGILKNFVPNFSATVVELLSQKGMIVIGHTNMDELGMGGTGLESVHGPVHMPGKADYIVGGSSSGSVVANAINLVPLSFGSDTGNSVRFPSALAQIIGFKPSLGAISRFGLFPYSPSLDTVGVFAYSLTFLETIMEILIVLDPKDFAMQRVPLLDNEFKKPCRVAIVGLNSRITPKITIDAFKTQIIPQLQALKYDYKIIELEYELTSLLEFLYQVLTFPDALSSHANLTGFNFGYVKTGKKTEFDFDESIIVNRTAGFGYEVKKRYTIGAYYVDGQNYYDIYTKSLQMIKFINIHWRKRFADYDVLIHPATAKLAATVVSKQKARTDPSYPNHIIDDYFLISNFLGCPSLTLPILKVAQQMHSISLFSAAQTDFHLLKFAKKLHEWGK